MAWYDFLTGSKAKSKQVSRLTPEQQKLEQNLQQAVTGQGAGGAFGDVADYYRNLLGNDSQDFQAFAAPEMRRFNEQTIPGLAEQFAGMGAGATSSGGFAQSLGGAGADLSERLGALRGQLRQQGVAGLQVLGTQALQPTSDWMQTSPGSEGLISQTLSGLPTAIGSAFAGPVGGALVGGASNLFGKQKGSSNPYGNKQGMGQGYQGSFGGQLPMFGGR